jgi:hypothetical protein
MWLCVWLHVLRRVLPLSSPVTPLARLPLYLRQTQSHIGSALALLARKKLLIHAKPVRAAGTDGVSKGGGGVIDLPKTTKF